MEVSCLPLHTAHFALDRHSDLWCQNFWQLKHRRGSGWYTRTLKVPHIPRLIVSGRSPMKEQSIALVSCPSLLRMRSTLAILSCFASSEPGIEKGNPMTTAFTSLSFLFNSIRFRSEVFFSVWTVRSSWELRIHSFFRFGFAVSFRFGCLVLKAESRR